MSNLCEILITLTPQGQIRVRAGSVEGELLEEGLATALLKAFSISNADGLFFLASLELQQKLPTILQYWQFYARHFISAVCSIPDLEETRSSKNLVYPEIWALKYLECAPPLKGFDYLTCQVLETLWLQMQEHFDKMLQAHEGTAQLLLHKLNSTWNLVGRIYFHLAENKKDPELPFAFMSSYTTRIDLQSRPQHLPLAKAIQEFSVTAQQQNLVKLLQPIHLASKNIDWLKNLSDQGLIFHPQKWTAQAALRFLKDIPIMEEAGLIVRVPDWWDSKKTYQPQLTITLGDKKPGGLGIAALLDFNLKLSIGEEAMTETEFQQLLNYADGLALFRGKWIEIDHNKLTAVLEHWQQLKQKDQEGGISLIDGLKLLAGVGPLSSKPILTEKLQEVARFLPGRWLEDTLNSIRAPGRHNLITPGSELKATLRPYQEWGVHWLWMMNQLRFGACLADDMGLGKTIQILALLLIKKSEQPQHRTLLIVPTTLINNWLNEAQRFAPSLRLHIIHSSNKTCILDAELENHSFDLAITSYGMSYRIEALQKIAWNLLILDEAQAMKNPATRQAKTIKMLTAEHRLALTGTPVENGTSDLWSIFDFISPGLLGNASQFRKFLENFNDKIGSPHASLRRLVQPYILRRLKTDQTVIADLPEKTEIKSYCLLTKIQAAHYEESVKDLAKKLEHSEGIARRGLVLSFLLRLKQICNHPSLWTQDGLFRFEDSGKFLRLKEICLEIAEQQAKVLIFTQFKEITGVLQGFLQRIFGEAGFVLHGGTSIKQRKSMVEAFQDDKGPPFFILSLKAGGTGLNLTAASHVIHFDRWWNPAVENQASDRAYRIGQKNKVLVHKFVCKGTLEEKIDAIIEGKQAIADEILQGGGSSFLTEMSNTELLNLVRLDLTMLTEDG